MMKDSGGGRLRLHLCLCLVLMSGCVACGERFAAFQTGQQRQPSNKIRRKTSVILSMTFHEEPSLAMTTNVVTCRRRVIKVIGVATAGSSTLIGKSSPSRALSPEAASTAYDSYASTYDELDGGAASSILGLDEARAQMLKQARGRVLEIGVGTGLNAAKYNPELVTSVTMVDISNGMLQEAKARVESLQLPFRIDFVNADATSQLVDLFGEHAFDTVVDSFSLCVMGNDGARKCLEQVRQVVKAQADGGRILLLENSRSSSPLLGWYQDKTADVAASAGGKGCVYNQDVRALIEGTNGLMVEKEASYVAGLFRSFQCVKAT